MLYLLRVILLNTTLFSSWELHASDLAQRLQNIMIYDEMMKEQNAVRVRIVCGMSCVISKVVGEIVDS